VTLTQSSESIFYDLVVTVDPPQCEWSGKFTIFYYLVVQTVDPVQCESSVKSTIFYYLAVQTVNPVQCESSVKSTPDIYSGNTSIPAHVTNSDQFSFALSPIRTIIDSSGFKLGPNATGEDTFALETEDDARRSSTPTDFKDLPLKPTTDESSMSFHFGDVSTQQRVDRIKNL
jgi:hypothetical protein